MELEKLTNQLMLSHEEMRMLQVKVRRCEDKIQELHLEYEDVEADLDDNAVQVSLVFIEWDVLPQEVLSGSLGCNLTQTTHDARCTSHTGGERV